MADNNLNNAMLESVMASMSGATGGNFPTLKEYEANKSYWNTKFGIEGSKNISYDQFGLKVGIPEILSKYGRTAPSTSGGVGSSTPGVPSGGSPTTTIGTQGTSSSSGTYVDSNGNTRKISDNSLVSTGGTDKVSQSIMRPSYATDLGATLSSFLKSGLSGYTPGQTYGGQLTSPMTGIEQQGLDQLSSFLNQGKGTLTTAAEEEALKTVRGDYANAETSPYVQSLQALSQRNLQENIDTVNRQRAGLGRYFKSETAASQDKLVQNAAQDLNAQIASFLNTERDRQTGAITTAAGLDKLSHELNLNKIAASQEYGGLQRLIEQAGLEREYQAWLNSRGETSDLTGAAVNLATDNPAYGIKTWYFG